MEEALNRLSYYLSFDNFLKDGSLSRMKRYEWEGYRISFLSHFSVQH